MITYILYGLFILSCIVLVVAVLLQPGKADAGALFASSVSSTAFGPRGTQTLLAKITIGAAAAFMLIALTLSLPVIAGKRSVLQSTSADPQTTPPPQPSPAASVAPSTAASPAQGTGTAGQAENANTGAPAPSATAQPAGSPQGAGSPAQQQQGNKKP